MAISSAQAIYGLNAASSPNATNVSGTVQIGPSQTQIQFLTAINAYSVRAIIADGSTVAIDLLTNDTTGSDAWVAGAAQVETATAAGTISGSGNAAVVFTGPVVGSPISLSVPVLTGDTASVWAEKVRVALAANGPISDNYTVSGSGTSIIVTRKPWQEVSGVPFYLTNNGTLNISLDNGTCTGITTASTSANTTPGVATEGTIIYDGDEDVWGDPLTGAVAVAALFITCTAGTCTMTNGTDTYEIDEGMKRPIIGNGTSSAFSGSSDFTILAIDNAVEITLTAILL